MPRRSRPRRSSSPAIRARSSGSTERRLLGLRGEQLVLGLDDARRSRRRWETRRSSRSLGFGPLQLVVGRLLAEATGARARHGVVQRVQPLHDDVLAVLERQRVPSTRDTSSDRALALAELILLAFQLGRDPREHLVGVLHAQVEVLLRVLFGEGVGRLRGELRIAVTVVDRRRAACPARARR